MIIATTPEAEATGEVADLYEAERRETGYIPSHTFAMAVNPAAFAGFQQIVKSTVGTLGLRRYELVTLAAARGRGSRHCRLAHGAKVLAKGVAEAPQLERIALDYAHADLSDAEVAMMRFAEKAASDASSMTDADSLELRAHGFSDREIADIAIAAAVRVYLGTLLQSLAVDVDEPPSLGEELREALVRGI
ncbi:carboxymuconolactone decarboxylase family protein [Agromyces sp. MMS24-JH15]|uniref:carboxymuconolactone decarboxylase family protein n=1 Tax=Agromyces sp. MMS24-JH15 TaxID=3243765 RepID=UPI00374A62D9